MREIPTPSKAHDRVHGKFTPLEIEYFLENPIALREESETLQSAIVLLAGTVDFRFI